MLEAFVLKKLDNTTRELEGKFSVFHSNVLLVKNIKKPSEAGKGVPR